MSKNKLFWSLQIIGWITFYLYHTFLTAPYRVYTAKDWFLYSITFIIGMLVTIGVRPLYRMAYSNFSKLIWLPVFIVIGSTISTAVWYFSDIYISHLFWDNGAMELKARLQPMYAIKYNYIFTIILTLWSALYFSIKYAWDWQEEKSKTIEAQVMAQKAQMEMLRYQLNPHFLFNSLNSIQALIDENTEHAKEMTGELSDFLRYSLSHKQTTYVKLSTEIEAIQLYFSIEKKRFEEKLDIQYIIADDVKDCQMLTFLLHPLIENAVKYGMRTSPMPLRISLSAERTEYGLMIEVSNTGQWIERNESNKSEGGTGTGLANVKERLENVYKGDHLFEIIKNDDSTCIRIGIREKYLLA